MPLQFALRVCRQTNFFRLFPRHFRQLRQFVLKIGAGDVVPKPVFQREDIDMYFFDPDDLRVGQPDQDFIGPNVDRYVLAQIESGFDQKSSA